MSQKGEFLRRPTSEVAGDVGAGALSEEGRGLRQMGGPLCD